MNSPFHTETNPNNDALDDYVRDVELACLESFGDSFELWSRPDAWVRVVPRDAGAVTPPDQPPDASLAALLQRGLEESEPWLADSSAGRVAVLPIPVLDRPPLIGVVRCPDPDSVWFGRLMHTFVRERRLRQNQELLRQELQAYAHQVTDDLEELTLLRNLAQWLELADISQDRWQLARSALPMLRHAVKAEAITLISAVAEKGDRGERVVRVGRPVVWTGSPPVDERTCLQLVEKLRERAAEHPVVKNGANRDPVATRVEGLRDYILVPILKEELFVGWLLAVNRVFPDGWSTNPDASDILSAQTPPWGLSDLEFGSIEASLLTSAASVLAAHARNTELFQQREELLVGVVRAMVSAIDARDPYTCGHSERVALYGRRLAEQIGLDAETCERLFLTGMLHDVGKIGISDATLKKPGQLTDEEFDEIKQHPDYGWKILHDLDQLSYVLPGVLHHHERVDGRGYPDGLASDDIPLFGRILAVADAYDAMTSDRTYRAGMPQEKAADILREGAGTQWDQRMIDAFFEIMPQIIQIRESYRDRVPPRRAVQAPPTSTLPPVSGLATADPGNFVTEPAGQTPCV